MDKFSFPEFLISNASCLFVIWLFIISRLIIEREDFNDHELTGVSLIFSSCFPGTDTFATREIYFIIDFYMNLEKWLQLIFYEYAKIFKR